MSGHDHPAPAQIRSRLDHPVIDGDGHWVEFDPVFAERMRKVGGDLAADGFLAALNPTAGLRLPRIHDDATRRAVIRAHNIVTADAFHNLGERMTPAAIIPMHTPEEAIAELEYVTRE